MEKPRYVECDFEDVEEEGDTCEHCLEEYEDNEEDGDEYG